MKGKNFVKLFLIAILTVGIFIPFSSAGDAKGVPGHLISKKEFVKLVKESDEYKNFKKDFLENQSPTVRSVKDNGKLIGYTIRYEIKYNETRPSSKNLVALNYNSLLTFSYDLEQDKLGAVIIDYSQMANDNAVYVRDLDSDKVEKVDISHNEQLYSFVKNTKGKAKKELKLLKDSNQSLLGKSPNGTLPATCWICSKYKKGGGKHDGECEALVGGACMFAGKVIWGRVVCAGGFIIGCYIPKYKICVAGSWHQCPLP